MTKQYLFVIIIPCYNEAKKFNYQAYSNFISKTPKTLLCFVNDGSSDSTLDFLQKLKGEFSQNVDIVSYEKNQGKAEAVRTGMLHCFDNYSYDLIAYLDADLAVSLEECEQMTVNIKEEILFCFGSRIARIGANIQRKRSRFLIGRVIATCISNILSLKVYDTQCGCKIFTNELAHKVFKEPFISTWLFDVEIFCRIIGLYKEKCPDRMLEVPLDRWVDGGDSKVKYSYFFKIFGDLYRIRREYRVMLKR